MMIFLLILKIIGIILCVILGVLAVILFVPVFYEADANIDEMDYKVRIHWLAKLIRFEFRWKGTCSAEDPLVCDRFYRSGGSSRQKSKERGKSPQKAVKAAEERSKKAGKTDASETERGAAGTGRP